MALAFALAIGSGIPARAQELRSVYYVTQYNELVRMFRDRAEVTPVPSRWYGPVQTKNPASAVPEENSVTQSDLNGIRWRTVHLLKNHYCVGPERFNPDHPAAPSAFPPAWPGLMYVVGDVQGLFTKVPPQHTQSGLGVYANDFSDAPLLPIHFEELYVVLLRMRYMQPPGGWTANGESNDRYGAPAANDTTWPDAVLRAQESYNGPMRTVPLPPLAWTKGWNDGSLFRAGIARRRTRYQVSSLRSRPHVVRFFYFAHAPENDQGEWYDNGDAIRRGRWTCWAASDPSTAPGCISPSLGSLENYPLWCNEPRQRSLSLGYEVVGGAAVVEWTDLYMAPPETFDDPEEDGCDGPLVPCGDCPPGVGVQWGSGTGGPVATFPAGASDGSQTAGQRLAAYYTEAFVAGVPIQRFSPGARLAAHVKNDAEGWEFVILRRPTAVDVPFGMKGSAAGRPVSPFQAQGYRVERTGNAVWLRHDSKPSVALKFESAIQSVETLSASPDPRDLGSRVNPLESPTGARPPQRSLSAASAPPDPHAIASIGVPLESVRSSSGSATHLSVLAGHREVLSAISPDNWLGVRSWTRNGVHAGTMSADGMNEVAYDGAGLINRIAYRNAQGQAVAQIEIETVSGVRIYRQRDGAGTLIRETRIVRGPNRWEVWRGRPEGAGFAGSREIRVAGVCPTTGVVRVAVTNLFSADGVTFRQATACRIVRYFAHGYALAAATNGWPSAQTDGVEYRYHADRAAGGAFGRLSEERRGDGSWTRYEYDTRGRPTRTIRPFLSSPPGSAPEACRVERLHYWGDPALGVFPAADAGTGRDTEPRLSVEEVLGREVARTWRALLPDRLVEKRCPAAGASWEAADSLVTTTYHLTNGVFEGRVRLTEQPDGTLGAFAYAGGSGAETTVTRCAGSGANGTVTNGERTVTVSDAAGRVLTEESADIAGGLVLRRVRNTRDALGRVLCASNAVSGLFSVYAYGCCGVEREVDEEGIETVSLYDAIGRVDTVTRLGVTTVRTFDARGAVAEELQMAAGGGLLARWWTRDAAGRDESHSDELGRVTRYAYGTNALGGRTVTTLAPDGSRRVEEYHRDGRLRSVSGSGAHPRFHDAGVDDAGPFAVEYHGTDASAPQWIRAQSDRLGRTVRTEFPDGYASAAHYDDRGRVCRESDGFTTVLYEYDAKGEPFRTAVDMNGDGVLDPAGPDRVTETESGHCLWRGRPVRFERQYEYPEHGSAARREVSVVYAAVDGADAWQIAFGRTNHTAVARDRARAARTETVTLPDGTRGVRCYTNGLLVAEIRADAMGREVAATRYRHDAFGRVLSVSEPAANGDIRVTDYLYDQASTVTAMTLRAGNLVRTTSYAYDAMGRRIRVVLPDGAVQETAYDTRGQVVRQSGARQYPVAYTYTGRGELESLSTYRNGPGGAPDVTRWSYDPARGWPVAKTYADGSVHRSAYRADGRLTGRVSARGVTATYAYDAAGAVTNVGYGGSMAPVRRQYDRLGRLWVEHDGAGARTNGYGADGLLLSVTLPQAPGSSLAYGYDAAGRMTNAAWRTAQRVLGSTGYRYDVAGRPGSVLWAGHSAVYRYGSDGRTWTAMELFNGASRAVGIAREYDGLGRLARQTATPVSAATLGFAYGYNAADLRATNTLADGSSWVYGYDQLGQLVSGRKRFGDRQPVGGAQFEYRYDTIGNRTMARNFIGRRTLDESYAANALNQYDQRTVPGRVWVSGTADPAVAVTVRADAQPALPANRHGDYFWRAVDVDNTAGLYGSTNVRVTATAPYEESGAARSRVRTEVRRALVPQTPERFRHDADGNLVEDGLWTYAWDCENRLVGMESQPQVPAAQRRRLAFRYDAVGRRVSKVVETWDGTAWTVVQANSFIYDGWNLIAEIATSPFSAPSSLLTSDFRLLVSSSSSTNLYAWGLDLSGTLQGAGGIGGLLFASFSSPDALQPTACIPLSDGNGNIVSLVDDTGGAVLASYDYGPFGELLTTALNPQSPIRNPFRFSSKYLDPETDLHYFGYRYYSAPLGRWLSRDPLEEDDAADLYAFVKGNPLNSLDPLGMAGIEVNERDIYWNSDDGFSAKIGTLFLDKAYNRQMVRLAPTFGRGEVGLRELKRLAREEPRYLWAMAEKRRLEGLREIIQTAFYGLRGLPYQMALLSKNVYSDKGAPEGWCRVGDRELRRLGLDPRMFVDTKTTFFAALYRHCCTGAYVLAFRGTRDRADWGREANAGQAFGLVARQYERGMDLARDVHAVLQSRHGLLLTGHSLGGGLASAAALRISAEATVFNPAGLHTDTLRRHECDFAQADHLIAKYVVRGELLDFLQTPSLLMKCEAFAWYVNATMPDSIGRDLRLDAKGFYPPELFGRLFRHFMDTVLQAEPRYKGGE